LIKIITMYSTQRLPSKSAPVFYQNLVCGNRLKISKSTTKLAEDGLRLNNKFKKNLPDLPLVSVITVVRNRAIVIEQCILSILNQTYSNIEYIVIDGASTDETLEIIEKYKEAIDYYVSEADDGIYDAMNKGLSLATGEYIIFLNSDDWYDRNAIAELVKTASRESADVVHADALAVSNSGFIVRKLTGWLDDSLYLSVMPLRHETMLVNKNIYNKFGGYDSSFKIIADYEFVIRLYNGCCKFIHLSSPLLFFRMTGISNINNTERLMERKRLFKMIFPFLDDYDLNILSNGATITERLQLMEKHKTKSELYSRSMAYCIASPSAHLNNFLISIKFKPAIIFLSTIINLKKFIASNIYWFKYKFSCH